MSASDNSPMVPFLVSPFEIIEEIELRAQAALLMQQKEDLTIGISLLRAKLRRLRKDVQEAINKNCELS